MILKIFFLIVGIVLMGIGAPMSEGNLNEKHNPYKVFVGAQIATIGVITAAIAFFSIFPQLLDPFK